VFLGSSHFERAHFIEGGNFIDVTFKNKIDFSNTIFGGKMFFIGIDENVCFGGECHFVRLNLLPDTYLCFEDVSLEQASFIDTNLEGIVFRNVQWHQRRRSLFVRGISSLWDEFPRQFKEEVDYERVAENYRQLVLIYEQKRDYVTAEQFHVGEMEIRRKRKGAKTTNPWLRHLKEWCNAYNIYRISSNYGTSSKQALMILFSLILLFSLMFLYTGIQPSKEYVSSEAQMIEYDVLSDSNHKSVSFRRWLSDYEAAVSLSLSIITFQKDRYYEPIEGTRLWLYAAVIVLSSQTALVLLAIRRRFKR
jgi:hypothetical protein